MFLNKLIPSEEIEFKIQYKTYVNWNTPNQTRKKLFELSSDTLNELVNKNIYFKNDLLRGMISFDKKLSQTIFSRLSHQTLLDLLMSEIEKIMEVHFSSDYTQKETYISKSCWKHVSAQDFIKAFNAFAGQDLEVKDLDMAAIILNVFQSIILKDETVIRLNKQVEMIQVGIQLGNKVFDELIDHYPWLYFYFKELVILHKDSGLIEVEQMQDLLKPHGRQAHIYRDIIQLANQLLRSFDFDKLMDIVYGRGYADEVIEPLLIHLTKRSLISKSLKDQLFYFKKKGFGSLWQKSA